MTQETGLSLICILVVCLLLAAQPALSPATAARAALAQRATTLLSADPNWQAAGQQPGAEFGTAVAGAGDVDCDGYGDVLVGAPKYETGVSREGAAMIYFGSGGGLHNNPGWLASSGSQGAAFGKAVATAGDINGDGCDDVMVGAPNYKYNNDYQVGAAFVYYGDPEGPHTTHDWKVEGQIRNSDYGGALGTAGDVDGDGYDDVIVGARWHGTGGAAFLYYGSPDGLSLTPAWTYQSEQSGANLGAAVGTAGDVNGDGYQDVIVGAPLYQDEQTDGGAAFIFYGSADGLAAIPDLTLQSNRAQVSFGTTVGSAGDVNGDGYSDVLVTAPGVDNDLGMGGLAFAYYGSSYGLSPYPNWLVESDQLNARFGWAAGGAGDADQDGYQDVIIGAHLYNYDNDDQSTEGAVFAYQGGPGGLSTSANWQAHDNKGYTTEFGIAAGTAGDVDGDGCADVIVGAPSYKLHTNEVVGMAFVYHGNQQDTQTDFRVHLPMMIRSTQ